ncbi:AzlD domain-containing protein [Yoonia vestfoldensis]|jgi:branched-subunit amino acid transport protein|uniref:Branched-chain amino acid transport protein (AzlD) n=1 Tax=Yoonia vestfoldensis TaxID=245188 RepID=A0A1Y0EEY9_9RHOB|nr:AzlD domain-containing protein [Yoonia vestfoldensis]ARU02167.1 branched-chain amino acid transport protein (AzlD) [Yoonia vestfoldensis]
MTYTTFEIWLIIAILGIGTFLIRFSFLGLIGDRPMPPVVLKLLRFTPVAVLPGMVAPLVLWPAATQGTPDPARMVAAVVTVAVGVKTRSAIWGIAAGIGTLYLALWLFAIR